LRHQSRVQALDPAAQIDFADAAVQIKSARLLLEDACEIVRTAGEHSAELTALDAQRASFTGALEQALVVLQTELAGSERPDWSRVIVDASLVDAKKGVRRSRSRSAAALAVATTSP